MCWKWHQMSALAERSGRGEVKPSLFRTVMKTDARALKQGARGKPQLLEPPGADPHAGWCGRGERATAPPIPILYPRGLLGGLHHNPLGRDGEGSTDAGNGIAVQIVVGVVAGAGVRVSTLIDPRSLANFQRSRRIAAAEGIEREIEVGKIECLLARHLPRAVTRTCHRKGTKGKLVGFRVASSSGVGLNPLEGVSRNGHGVEPRPFRSLGLLSASAQLGRVLRCCRRGSSQ